MGATNLDGNGTRLLSGSEQPTSWHLSTHVPLHPEQRRLADVSTSEQEQATAPPRLSTVRQPDRRRVRDAKIRRVDPKDSDHNNLVFSHIIRLGGRVARVEIGDRSAQGVEGEGLAYRRPTRTGGNSGSRRVGYRTRGLCADGSSRGRAGDQAQGRIQGRSGTEARNYSRTSVRQRRGERRLDGSYAARRRTRHSGRR